MKTTVHAGKQVKKKCNNTWKSKSWKQPTKDTT